MTDSKLDEADIFNVARKLDSPIARAEYLQQACGADDAIRAKVSRLLGAYDEQPSFLAAPVSGLIATIDQTPPERLGTQIGPYKLLQQIGEGGMGVVYMAEQKEPVERRVALKIIKPGMDSRQVIARFEAERQALAMMDHQNIAKVFEAGTTDSGRPYFVMELVKGVPITKYCDEKHLSLKERLELMIPVCQAIQHAHQKGIIHRDIKPTNVLVAQYDGRPVPKVIDFGIAKATAQKLTERTMFTELGQLVGTLEYMSPEQAELNQLDIDTRSDIYSLGVLLYELLTGSTPFDKQKLRTAAFHEMLRIIREDEPERPSTRLQSSPHAPREEPPGSVTRSVTTTLASIAAVRSTEPAKLTKLVRGELDWIVMKALEKDRNRRYESASSLAADIQRYLNDEPVQACPPSAGYRFRKFARRNKTVITTATLVTLAVLIGLFASVWQAARATRAEGVADRNYGEAQREAKAAKTAQREALMQSERSQQLRVKAEEGFRIAADSVDKLVLTLTDERLATIPQLQDTRKELFADAVTLFDRVIQLDPKNSLASLQRGQAHQALGHADNALSDYQKAIELDPTNHRAHRRLADFYNGYQDLARRDYQQALKHINAAIDLAPSEQSYQINRARIVSRTDYPQSLRYHADVIRQEPTSAPAYWARAATEWEHGDFAASLADADQAIRLAPRNSLGYQQRGCALKGLGRLDEALQALDRAKDLAPYNHYVYYDRGDCLFRMGRYQDAIAEFSAELALVPEYHISYKRRAAAYFESQQYLLALDDLRSAIHLNPTDLSTLTWIPLYKLVGCPDATFRDGFLKLVDETVELNSQARISRAAILTEFGQSDRARADVAAAVVHANDDNTGRYCNDLAWLLATSPAADLRDPVKAVEVAQKATELMPDNGMFWNTLGVAHYRAGNCQNAIAALEKSMQFRQGGNSLDWFFLAMAHWQLGRKDEARKWYGQAVERMEKTQPPNEELLRFRAEAAELLDLMEVSKSEYERPN